MIAELRIYVDERIKAVDPRLDAETSQVFGNDNPSKNLSNKRYNLILGSMTNDRDDHSHYETLSFMIDIYVKPEFNAQAPFDDLLIKARCIRDEIIFKQNLGKTIFFDIESDSISPIQEINNDKAFRMQLEFKVVHKYCIK